MWTYALRRLLHSVFLVWGVLTLVFVLADLVPGDSFHQLAARGTDPQAAEHLRSLFGTDRSLPARYVDWLGGVLRADLGVSLTYREGVAGLVLERMGNSLLLAAFALVCQFALGTAAGIAAASNRGGRVDRAITLGAGLLYATPSFCIALLLVGSLSVGLGWLPASQMESIDAGRLESWQRWLDRLRHLLLPCLALSLPVAGGLALYVRDELLVTMRSAFVRAASARGLSPGSLLVRHGLRMSIVPLSQLMGLSLPALVGGGVVIEVVFAWPGMGRLTYDAVLARDLPLVLGCTLAGSLAVVVGNLLADLAAALADPRTRETPR